MSECATVQIDKQSPRTVGERVACIITKLLAAAPDIEAMKAGQITITVDVGQQPSQVKLIVPKQY